MKDKGIQLKNTIWAKPKVEKLQLLKGIFNIAKDVATSNLPGIPADALDAIGAIKLSDGPGKIGWKLISRSLADALSNLIIENKPDLEKKTIKVEQLDKDLNGMLESEEFFVGVDFFKHPDKLPFIDKIKPALSKFLLLIGFDKNEIENILNRLPGYFVFSLINEWRLNYKYYQTLREVLVTPFDGAARRGNEWYLYSKWLAKQVDMPMFSESFSLRQIYVPLRSFYNEKIKGKDTDKSFEDRISKDKHREIVVDLENELLQWLDKADKSDGIRIIRGGPGYGKSSFLKMFAAKLANDGKRVLFIPLHLFEVRDDLTEAIRNFIRYDEFLTVDPFEEDRLIIIFDGLDELSMQGAVLADVASQFLREIERKITNYNSRKIKLQVLISGRDVIVQQNEDIFRKDGQILRLLPYYLNEKESKGLIDKGGLLKEDQRNIWWQNYGKLKGTDYKGLPPNLQNTELDEITAQPLLNYLVALSYERGKIDFSADTNLNDIYNDLLEAVYERNYAEGKIHKTVKKLKSSEFTRMLEEIATASWHGDGRTTTVAEIEKHFKESGLKRLLDNFIKEAEKGVITLLAAFYFRQAGQDIKGAQTFEFTHKSFGEYLTSKRIVNKIIQIHKKATENEDHYDEGWHIKECLTE